METKLDGFFENEPGWGPSPQEPHTLFTNAPSEGCFIHHQGNVHDCCCDCGCCHTNSCSDVCIGYFGLGECLDGYTDQANERAEADATAKRLLEEE